MANAFVQASDFKAEIFVALTSAQPILKLKLYVFRSTYGPAFYSRSTLIKTCRSTDNPAFCLSLSFKVFKHVALWTAQPFVQVLNLNLVVLTFNEQLSLLFRFKTQI